MPLHLCNIIIKCPCMLNHGFPQLLQLRYSQGSRALSGQNTVLNWWASNDDFPFYRYTARYVIVLPPIHVDGVAPINCSGDTANDPGQVIIFTSLFISINLRQLCGILYPYGLCRHYSQCIREYMIAFHLTGKFCHKKIF